MRPLALTLALAAVLGAAAGYATFALLRDRLTRAAVRDYKESRGGTAAVTTDAGRLEVTAGHIDSAVLGADKFAMDIDDRLEQRMSDIARRCIIEAKAEERERRRGVFERMREQRDTAQALNDDTWTDVRAEAGHPSAVRDLRKGDRFRITVNDPSIDPALIPLIGTLVLVKDDPTVPSLPRFWLGQGGPAPLDRTRRVLNLVSDEQSWTAIDLHADLPVADHARPAPAEAPA